MSIPVSVGDLVSLRFDFPSATAGSIESIVIWEAESDGIPNAPLVEIGKLLAITFAITVIGLVYLRVRFRNRSDARRE
jgi:hypothetical protein